MDFLNRKGLSEMGIKASGRGLITFLIETRGLAPCHPLFERINGFFVYKLSLFVAKQPESPRGYFYLVMAETLIILDC